mmetsp:Transcript_11862/g.36637  ORF Transcript_11862/g.36637 Transcript_11862/m.36637 type:complete len:212 (+) Transcript_11862:632-1267(+)|eukprot:scaffold217538_cov30-Tisochrysis_lutea.AAC.2
MVVGLCPRAIGNSCARRITRPCLGHTAHTRMTLTGDAVTKTPRSLEAAVGGRGEEPSPELALAEPSHLVANLVAAAAHVAQHTRGEATQQKWRTHIGWARHFNKSSALTCAAQRVVLLAPSGERVAARGEGSHDNPSSRTSPHVEPTSRGSHPLHPLKLFSNEAVGLSRSFAVSIARQAQYLAHRAILAAPVRPAPSAVPASRAAHLVPGS